MAIKICLDAGHYGKYNQSPANKAYYESDMAWKLHLLQKKYLEQYGFEVILTRNNQDTDRPVYERGTASKGCDLFISNHSNATGTYSVNETVDYPVVYVPLNGSGTTLGQALAECITATMGTQQKGYAKSRAGESGDYYGVIRGATAVGTIGLLLEHSFHTNTRATNWLLDDSNLDKLAKAEANVIAEHFGMKPSKGLQAIDLKDMAEADIVELVGPLCTEDMKKTGILASVTMAQFILECGYGKTELAQNANNCFGMKSVLSGNTWGGSTWDGTSVYKKPTAEWVNGQYVNIIGTFRKYPSVEDSIADHSAYLLNGMNGDKLRYAGLKCETDYVKAITIIKNGGYATSPDYIEKICKRVEMWDLTRFDGNEPAAAPKIKPLSGYVKVIYKGEDGLNVRTSPRMGDNVKEVVHEGLYTVKGISTDGDWYLLKSGGYITTGTQYVKFIAEDSPTPYMVRVKVDDLKIRKGPGVGYDSVDCTGIGSFTIIEEKTGAVDKKGTKGKWGLLLSYKDKSDGWICLEFPEYTEKVK